MAVLMVFYKGFMGRSGPRQTKELYLGLSLKERKVGGRKELILGVFNSTYFGV